MRLFWVLPCFLLRKCGTTTRISTALLGLIELMQPNLHSMMPVKIFTSRISLISAKQLDEFVSNEIEYVPGWNSAHRASLYPRDSWKPWHTPNPPPADCWVAQSAFYLRHRYQPWFVPLIKTNLFFVSVNLVNNLTHSRKWNRKININTRCIRVFCVFSWLLIWIVE